MPQMNILQIIVGEFEIFKNSLLYRNIIDYFLRKDFINMTIYREDEGIGQKNDFRTYSLESIQFNNLPIKIEVVNEEKNLNDSILELNSMISHGQISSLTAYEINETEQLPPNQFLMIKIYMDEKNSWFKRPVYQEILSFLNEYNLIWSTVKRGIHGYGEDKSPRKKPIVIEAVGSAPIITQLIPQIKAKISDGFLIVISVDVIANK